MRRLHHLLICAVLSTILAGCTGQPTAPGPVTDPPPAPTTCAPDETVHDNPELADALRSALKEAKLKVIDLGVSAHVRQCQDPTSGQGVLPSTTSVDVDLRLSSGDLTEATALGAAARKVVDALEVVTPGMPGDVGLTFVNSDVELPVSFTRDQARQALVSDFSSESLLSALGYPPAANSAGECSPVWGKQPLPNLARLAREEVARANLSTIQIAAAVTGTWCGDQFSAAYTEYHVDVGWLHGTEQVRSEKYGQRVAPVIEIILALPEAELQGDLTPRLVVVKGWFSQVGLTITLPEARSAVEEGLSGAALTDRLNEKAIR